MSIISILKKILWVFTILLTVVSFITFYPRLVSAETLVARLSIDAVTENLVQPNKFGRNEIISGTHLNNSAIFLSSTRKWWCPRILCPRPNRTNSGSPHPRKSAGRSGQCSNLSPIVALVPWIDNAPTVSTSEKLNRDFLNSISEWTLEEHPTFWLYIPPLPERSEPGERIYLAEFMLQVIQDEQEVNLTNSEQPFLVRLPEMSGIVGFHLSSNVLQRGKLYHWYFSLLCDRRRPSRNPSVDDWIQLVDLDDPNLDPNLESQLAIANTPEERAKLLAANGFWYDSLTTLGKKRCSSPGNTTLSENWVNLLKDGKLESFVQYPIVGLSEISENSLIDCTTR